MAKRMKIDL